MAVLGIRYIYTYLKSRGYSTRLVFIFLIGLFFCFRLYGYLAEINRFNDEIINSYKIDFTQPAAVDNISYSHAIPFHIPSRKWHYDQVYYYKMAQFISIHLKSVI